MKPIHLNLAARPFRDYRPLYAVVVVTSLLIAFLMLNNIDTYYRYKLETKTTRARIAEIDAQTEQEKRRADVAMRQIQNVDTKSLDDQTRFVNSRLAERAFSWSELLDHLEDVLADDVRIISVVPAFNESGTVQLALDCEAKTTGGLVTTIRRFQSHGHFKNPFPMNEDFTGSVYRFRINVEYRPSFARVVK